MLLLLSNINYRLEDKMEIMVAPISGDTFPRQLSMLRRLTRHGYKPAIALSSSGGCVCTYLAMASHWDPNELNRVVRSISSDHFITSWFTGVLECVPSVVAGMFMGSMYKRSLQTIKVFETYFSPSDLVDIEVWTSAVNEETGAVCLFCNRSQCEAIIKGENFKMRTYKSEPLNYMDGDITRICDSTLATSSVPMLIQPQLIGDKRYIDSGTKFASPLAPLQDEIKLLGKQEGGLHIIYINGYNIEVDLEVERMKNIIDQGRNIACHVIRGFVLHDRMVARNLICGSAPCSVLHFADVCVNALDIVYSRRRLTSSSLLEIYPITDMIINYTNFKGEDVIKIMDEVYDKCAGRLWWIGNPYIFMDVPGVNVHE